MELEELLRNQSYRRILKFFHENPASIDTARGIATWTNQDPKKVRTALKRLAALGLLVTHDTPSTIGYSYIRDEKMISKIGKLLKE